MTRNKKMLMIGPGRGHNIIPILKALENQAIFKVDFLCHALEFSQDDFKCIYFIPFPKARRNDFLSIIKYISFHLKHSIFGKRYDVLHIQGETGLFLLFLLVFAKAKVKIFSPWSYGIIKNAFKKSKEGIVSRLIFKQSDYISLNWHEKKDNIKRICPSCKILMFYWGLTESFFMPPDKKIESKFVKDFLDGISESNVVVFWPRSIIKYHRQDIVVEALAKIKKHEPEILKDFILYLWPGNVEDKVFRKKIERSITENSLADNVKIIDHPFVSFNDIRIIENRSDFFIQISEHDGISTFILEMLLQEKDIILSNISSYKHLNDFFNLKFELVNNDAREIADAIKSKILKLQNPDKEILRIRRNIVEKNFRFSENYKKFIMHLDSLS